MKNICFALPDKNRVTKFPSIDNMYLLNVEGDTVDIKLPDISTLNLSLRKYTDCKQTILDLTSDINLLNLYLLSSIHQRLYSAPNVIEYKVILNDIYNTYKKYDTKIDFFNPFPNNSHSNVIYVLRSYKDNLQIIFNRYVYFLENL